MTVILAYRVVATFTRQARKLTAEESVPYLDRSLREYVRNLLSMLHPSIMDLGERSAVTQLGDPDPATLIESMSTFEAGHPREVVEQALTASAAELSSPYLSSRVFLLSGDEKSRVMVRRMNGVVWGSAWAPRR